MSCSSSLMLGGWVCGGQSRSSSLTLGVWGGWGKTSRSTSTLGVCVGGGVGGGEGPGGRVRGAPPVCSGGRGHQCMCDPESLNTCVTLRASLHV